MLDRLIHRCRTIGTGNDSFRYKQSTNNQQKEKNKARKPNLSHNTAHFGGSKFDPNGGSLFNANQQQSRNYPVLKKLKELAEVHNEQFPLLSVIIFNASNAHLIEALRKQTYVDALNELTGKNICVFWAALPEGKVELPSMQSGAFGMMLPVYKEPSSNKALYEYFDIISGESLPLLVTFSFGENGELFYSKHPLADQSSEGAFNTLKGILSEKADLLSDFSKDLKADKKKMFSELGVFDIVNDQAGLLGRFIKMLATLRSASSI